MAVPLPLDCSACNSISQRCKKIIVVLTPQLYIEEWVYLPVHFPISSSRSSSSSNTMCLLDYIDRDLTYRDPELAAAILEFEGIQVITLCYLHLQMKKKGKKAQRTWVCGYLKRRATKGHYGNLCWSWLPRTLCCTTTSPT